MAVANCLQMLKTVIMGFSVIKPHFSRRLSRLFFSAGSRLSRIFCGRLTGLAQFAAGGRLSRRLGGLINSDQIPGSLSCPLIKRNLVSVNRFLLHYLITDRM